MFKFTSKNVIYVVHVLVKRSTTFKNSVFLCSSFCKILKSMVDFEPRTSRSTSDDDNRKAKTT